MKKYHTVTFLPENKTLLVEDRKTIFETIELENPQGIALNFARCCGAEGICQKCKIRAFQKMGPLTPIEKGCLSDDELARGIRLSCQARVMQDTQVEIIYKQPFSIKLVDEHPAVAVDLQPRVKKIFIKTPDEILSLKIDGSAKQTIVDFLKNAEHGCTAVLIDEDLVAIEAGDTTAELFAAAVDLGINTLALSLIDLSTGRSLAVVSDTNPQLQLGADVATRMSLSLESPLNLEILSEEVLLRIDVLLHELCRAKDISSEHVYEITLSGATGMLHLFLKGIPGLLEQHASFQDGKSMVFTAQHASIKSSPHARLYTLPTISAYVGADITAGIIATQLHRSLDTVLFLDLGTTGKAVLHHQGTITAASISEGAAFECIGIQFGMRPVVGAIEQVSVNEDIHVEVIGESLPRGICGSGFIELVGRLLTLGMINAQGDFAGDGMIEHIVPEIAKRLIATKQGKSFLLFRDEGEFASDIYVTQDDIYALIRAKANLLAAIRLLLEKAGIDYNSVARALIGGAFGYHINVEAFISIGLIPQELRGKVFFVGNTSAAGAHLALLDRAVLEEAEQIAREVKCLDPHGEPRFETMVQETLNFLPPNS